MHPRKDRIVVDTNLWISFLISKNLSKLDLHLSQKSITFLFSQELINEFIEVARRPRLKRFFSSDDFEKLLFYIQTHAEYVTVKSEVKSCRDPKDNFLLSLAKDGKANYLITGDKDLLEIEKFGKTSIVTMTQFLLEKGTIR